MRKPLFFLALLALPWVGACSDPLEVDNLNDPNRGAVLASPADLENWIRDSFNAWFRAAFTGETMQPRMRVMSLENFSELANFGQNLQYAIPRSFWENSRGMANASEPMSNYTLWNRASRSSAIGVARLDDVNLGSDAVNARGRAFGWFTLGLALGYMSIPFDSAAVAWPTDDPACTGLECFPLVGYAEVNAKAIEALDSAEAIAAGGVTFTLPAAWLRQGGDVNQAGFLRIIRSYRAVIRIGAARNAAERAAVDWTAVLADANNGITGDFTVNADPANNWTITWPVNVFRPGSWHAMHQLMIGGADTTGAFQTWLNTPRGDKVQFLIRTPDERFPSGETRGDQSTADEALPDGQYFRNRPSGDDTPGDPLGNSMYDNYRFYAFYDNSRNGPFPVLTKAEIDLIAAEAYLRNNDIANAAAKIDISRTAAGLPALTGNVANLTDPVPGGTACVPRVANWTGSTYTTPCGTIWDALKWEKRLETSYTNFANWFMDSRGWGDLPEGTPVHFPVPWQEKDARRDDFITTFGGCDKVGTGEAAPASTFGPVVGCS
jgi:hypothetical protein